NSHHRAILRAVPRLVSVVAVLPDASSLVDRLDRSSGARAADARARLYAGDHSVRLLAVGSTGAPSMGLRGAVGRGGAGDRTGDPLYAACLGAVERRDDGEAVFPVAGDQPLRAAGRSSVHDSDRGDG